MITLTDLLLFFILVTLATYTFMPWKGIDKGPKLTIIIQFIGWTFIFFVIVFVLKMLGIINEF